MLSSKLIRALIAALALAAPCSLAQDKDAIGDVLASDTTVHGSVVLADSGTRLLSGSTVTAGNQAAVVRLVRGGEVRVCPSSTVTLTTSRSRTLMIALVGGCLETHYSVAASADAVMTPDFRILLPGPGDFHLAIRNDSKGNTCIRSLPGNGASAIVNELLGEGIYQVKPGESVVFHGGQIANASHDGADCGCPPPPPPVQRAAAPPPPPPAPPEKPAVTPAALPAPVTASLPEVKPNETSVTVEDSFVFNWKDHQKRAVSEDEQQRLRAVLAGVPAQPLVDILPPASVAGPTLAAQPPAPEPAPAKQKKKKGFFGRVRSLFGSVFKG